MSFNPKYLLEQLDIKDAEMIELRSWVVSSMGNAMVIRGILDRQCENRDQTNCYSCEDEGVCSIITGIAHLDLGETNTAIKQLENGNQHFRSKDETWNSIIGLILLGKAHEKNGNSHQAIIEYKKAFRLLTENYIRVHANDYDELARARTLVGELNDQVTQPFSPRASTASSNRANPLASAQKINPAERAKAYLSLFSLPIYGIVTAGPDGQLQINPVESTATIVDQVELEGRMYDLFGIGHTAANDRQITLIPQEAHGWAKVRGLSMNGWKTPLDENDFVLFREAQAASHHDFVIASSRDPSGDLIYIVKKFDASAQQLLSNSTDTSRSYAPIPLDDEHKIFGVVIAVAKPAPNAIPAPTPVSPDPKSSTPAGGHPVEERRLYQKLLVRAAGDKEKIRKLIAEAFKKAPHESRLGLLKIVDENWIADEKRG